jgi:hypothetical protein
MPLTLRNTLPALLLAAAGTTPALAYEIGAEYGVALSGIGVGTARLRAEIDGGRYSVRFSTEMGGVARIFSDLETSLEVTGAVEPDGFRPELYSHEWREGDDAETAAITFAGHDVASAVVEPPPRKPERRVPISEADLNDVIDVATAFVWPTDGGLSPEICVRRLRIFDGTQRIDLDFGFTRSTSFEARDGSFSGPVMVCNVRFRPVSGYRRDKEELTFMAENEDLEVWMAEASGGYLMPVRIRIRTEHGWLGFEAREFRGSE